ncbi:MAG: hypothetical protein U0169_23440 [Polyangiaceae bacterium]
MIPWVEIGRTTVGAPRGGDGGDTLVLARRGDEFALRLARGGELMNSRAHASEDALATSTCTAIPRRDPHVLVGGLGMGFTLRAALDVLPKSARVTVVELAPEVVAWNRGELGDAAGRPLEDPRVQVVVGDVAPVVARSRGAFDAIAMDVDNGPMALTAPANKRLYGPRGLDTFREALREGGTLGVWSASDDTAFTARIERAGFDVRIERVPARPGGPKKHVLWIARRTPP